jgi:hypothetical protein
MTNSNYKIIKFNEATGQIIVRFRDMEPISVDLPIDAEGNALSGNQLSDYLRGFIPTWHYDRLEKISSGISNAAEIHALVEPEPTEEVSQPEPTYQDLRREEYPPIGDQLDALYHAGVFPNDMANLIKAVKDKYPKENN